jgi:hypothetical protein
MEVNHRAENRIAAVRKARIAIDCATTVVETRRAGLFDSTPEIDALADVYEQFIAHAEPLVAAAEDALEIARKRAS